MAGVSIERTLELWASSLRDVKARIRPLFTQERVAESVGQFVDGLLGNEPRKTGWMRAEAAGDTGPWRQRAILGRGRWDADALRDIVRAYTLETLADNDAVLVIDETGFLKQGKASCGVARQYTGSAGKITNCQIGVFATYVSRHGYAFIDRSLYLPKEWTDDRKRLKAAHAPEDVHFATKPQIARRMIMRAIATGVPFGFVSADSVYGVGDIEMTLRKAGKGYVLGVAANHVFKSWGKEPFVRGTAATIAHALPKTAWQRLPTSDRYKTISLKTRDVETAKERAFDQESDVRFRLKHQVPISNRPFSQIAKDFVELTRQRWKAAEITRHRYRVIESHVRTQLNRYLGSTQINLIGQDRRKE